MKRSHLAVLALAAASAGCSTGFEPQYRVTDLRILGVRAAVLPLTTPSRADVRPGEGVRVSTLVANPQHRGPLTLSFYGCVPTDANAFSACVDQEVLKDPARLADLATRPAETGVVSLGQLVFPKPAPGVPAPKAFEAAVQGTIPAAPGAFDPLLQRASAQPTYQCSLYADFPVVVVAEAEGLTEIALKRVRAIPTAADLAAYPSIPSTAYTVNDNPVIEDITRAEVGDGCSKGVPLSTAGPDTTFPATRVLLCGVPDQGQEFNVCDASGVASREGESRSWQWFVDAGEFPDFTGIGNAVDSNPEFQRPAGAFTIWIVLRDGRGGVDWGRRDVGAPP